MQGGKKIVESDWVTKMFLMVVSEFFFDSFYCVDHLKLLVRNYTKNL